jgi:diguanylate cyclase (GGDEF)-like protein
VPCHILVVEDEPSVRHILRTQLELAGYTVTTAENGAEGLEKAMQLHPDLLLLDVMMPEMDGFEVCRRLRQSQHTSTIPIIMLTARSHSTDKVRGLEVGANDYLEKPFQRPELLARVRGLLAWSQAQRDASPLTGLPGSAALEAIVGERLAKGKAFGLLYADIDQFKAYNDRYGYRRGDEAIRFAADLFVATVECEGAAGDVVGHIGGDDFLIVTSAERAETVADAIMRRFDEGAPLLYSPEDRARGYVDVETRQGGVGRAPLMSLTIAVVTTDGQCFTHYAGLIDVITQLKRYGKTQQGSIVVRNRRGDTGSPAEPAGSVWQEER